LITPENAVLVLRLFVQAVNTASLASSVAVSQALAIDLPALGVVMAPSLLCPECLTHDAGAERAVLLPASAASADVSVSWGGVFAHSGASHALPVAVVLGVTGTAVYQAQASKPQFDLSAASYTPLAVFDGACDADDVDECISVTTLTSASVARWQGRDGPAVLFLCGVDADGTTAVAWIANISTYFPPPDATAGVVLDTYGAFVAQAIMNGSYGSA
jgi:hypothetical protein